MGKGLDKSSSDKIINWEDQGVDQRASEMRDLLAQRTSWSSSFFRALSQRLCSKLEPGNRKIPWWNQRLVNAIKFAIVNLVYFMYHYDWIKVTLSLENSNDFACLRVVWV